MPLNDHQRLLAQNKASGLNDHEACLAAGYKPKTHRSACNQVARMMTNDDFVEYLEELRDEIQEDKIKTGKEVAVDLSELMDEAKTAKDFNGFVALANRLAKMRGHDDPERMKLEFEVTIGGTGDDD